MKWLREPLVHFIFIGMVIFLLYGLYGSREVQETGNTLTISRGEIAWLTDTWEKRWKRPPTPQERQGLVKQYLREMVLYREALAMGLDKDDTIVRRRLAQKLEFLANDLIKPKPPSEGELDAYFKEHMDRYKTPDLITMTHVFLDPDKRGDQTLKDAETIKAKLVALKEPPQDARSFGDPFMLQSYYPERSEAELAKLFGSGFAKPVFDLTPQQWHGPVLSGYGVHLVYVHHRQEPPPATFAEVKEQVRKDWENDKRGQLNEEYIAGLLERYNVTIEDDSTDKKSVASKEQAK